MNGSAVNDLSAIHMNVRLLNANVTDLNILLSLLIMKIDIVCLSETWIKKGDLIDHPS